MNDETVKAVDIRAFETSTAEEASWLRPDIVNDCVDGKIIILKNVDLGVDLGKLSAAACLSLQDYSWGGRWTAPADARVA